MDGECVWYRFHGCSLEYKLAFGKAISMPAVNTSLNPLIDVDCYGRALNAVRTGESRRGHITNVELRRSMLVRPPLKNANVVCGHIDATALILMKQVLLLPCE
jgi:hypothetical protein